MSNSISSHFSQLRADNWRLQTRFTSDLDEVQQRVFDSESEDEQKIILNSWLGTNQPCLFGRAVAKLDAITYCVLTESDLKKSDEWIREKIQNARLRWTQDGYEGKRSGFIIWVVSRSIASAEPSLEMRELARNLCSLYLDREIETDRIYLDEIFLELPGFEHATWRWFAGVNYFCSQGDGRWWHDHRIPGGMAFSVNSVGHLVKSAIIAKSMNKLADVLGVADLYTDLKMDSLEKALQIAMLTIDSAAVAVSGKATELIPVGSKTGECPIKLPAKLAGKDCSTYRGYYHTDITLPSEYFRPEVERPKEIAPRLLDFTYLYERSLSNPDFLDMGEGRRIREIPDPEEEIWPAPGASYSWSKSVLTQEEIVPVSAALRLQEALSRGFNY